MIQPAFTVCFEGTAWRRTAFGLNYTGTPLSPIYAGNSIPFNGIGTIQDTTYLPSGLGLSNRSQVVNNAYYPLDGVLFDPERIGYRTKPSDTTWNGGLTASQNYFPANASYTYPDAKDLYLAAVDPTSGQVLVPSFYRPWIFGGA